MPTDANQDNTYEVIVQASNDIGGVATQNLSVTVFPSPSDFGDAPDPAPAPAAATTRRAWPITVRGTLSSRACGWARRSMARLARCRTQPPTPMIWTPLCPMTRTVLINPAADLVLTIGAQPTVNVRVTNTTGAAATLYGWIDYNANGVFDNATERASVAVPDGFQQCRRDTRVSGRASRLYTAPLTHASGSAPIRPLRIPPAKQATAKSKTTAPRSRGPARARPTAAKPRRLAAASVAARRLPIMTGSALPSRRSGIWTATALTTSRSVPPVSSARQVAASVQVLFHEFQMAP